MSDESKSIIVTVDHRFIKSSGEEVCITDSREVYEAKPFEGAVARITRRFGVTLNMTNYEATRVDVGIEVPCYLEDAARADEWARDFIEKRLKYEVLALKDEKKSSSKPKI